MATQKKAPTDQRAEIRPIAFALDAGGDLSEPLNLKIRPEDLTRTEPSRLTVHQTLGRETAGWVDNFGAGLPTLAISGHTGWRATGFNAEDGVAAFVKLNDMVHHDYHRAKQDAIDSGQDPASVKLLFIDMLDGFAWNVAPTNFVLRRSKSRPLLLQYNINLQAVDTAIDSPAIQLPQLGGLAAGIKSLTGVLATLQGMADRIKGWVAAAVRFANAALAPFADAASRYAKMALDVFMIVKSTVGTVQDGFTSVANNLIGIAGNLASIGVNVFRTVSAIAGLPNDIKHNVMRVASAFNEMACILANSLRARATYSDYEGMFGASNCSSTTGGRPDSPYASSNAFKLMQPAAAPVSQGTAAQSSSLILRSTDPVLAPMPIQEVGRHLDNISAGTVFST